MKYLIFSIFFLITPSISFSEIKPIGPFNFGGGLNLQSDKTLIADDQSPDMCDCVSNTDGSLDERYGTERYISQAISTYSVDGLYRFYASSGPSQKSGLIAISGNQIMVSTSDKNPVWVSHSSGIVPYQNWSFLTMNDKVIFTGDKLENEIYKFDIWTSSISDLIPQTASTEAVRPRAKYLVQKNNYLMLVNVSTRTVYYPSRVYYSLLNEISSFTASRYFDIRTNDGEELMGAGVMFDRVNFFKQSSIHELDFTVLNLPSLGGDWILREIVNGFGLIAPRGIENTGLYYVIPSQDAIRIYDGGRRSRLSVSEESRVISNDIKPLIDKLIKTGKYKNSIGKYYKKRDWYLFAYEDADKFPRGRNNSLIAYDFRIQQWYPICGWNVASFCTFDKQNDIGDLYYGDSNDGYVYKADLEIRSDDARKEISVDPMESTTTWSGTRISMNRVEVKEGSGSVRMWINADVTQSSMTLIKVIPIGELYDKKKITKSDKLQFKYFATDESNVTSLRIDLEVNDDSGNAFDSNFTSITLQNDMLDASDNVWKTYEIALSSFVIRDDWVDFNSELMPFANTLTYYGLRFVVDGVDVSSVSIDDVRIIQNKGNPVNFYRFTKLFNFGSISKKTMGQVVLTMEKSADSSMSLDIYNDFGSNVNTKKIESEIPKEILVMGFISTASIGILDDYDFELKRSTEFNINDYLPFNGVADKKYIFFEDRTNDRMVKLDRNNMGIIVSTYGSIGNGTTNYNTVHQQDLSEDGNIILVDIRNQRVKKHSQKDFSFKNMSGTLGVSNTSYHQPTGITCNDDDCVVADEGNYRWLKIGISTFGYMSQVSIDYNTIGDTSLEQDEELIYGAYNKTSEQSTDFQEIVLEARFRGDLSLVNRVIVRPLNDIGFSTYALRGDIALRGRYIYISFTDNALGVNQTYYIQKRLKSDFSIVNEFTSTTRPIASILGDAFAHRPIEKTEKQNLETSGQYLQLKYYDDGLDNKVKLINQTFLIEPNPLTY